MEVFCLPGRSAVRRPPVTLLPVSFLDEEDEVSAWLAALESRHLADLTPSEVARALRALSSCYVERRARLRRGGALDTRGKRAAFALFYAPIHFLVVRGIVRELRGARTSMPAVVDLGCGSGAAGAAWARESNTPRVLGIDRHPWAVAEAEWTYRALGLRGRARRSDFTRLPGVVPRGAGVVAAYALNEIEPPARAAVLDVLLAAHRQGSSILVVEPVARRIAPWFSEWRRGFDREGGRSDEWRFPSTVPPRQRALARAAGLDPSALTARSLWLPGTSAEAMTGSPT